MTIDEARAKAHQQYDDCMFCSECSKLLTGMLEAPDWVPHGESVLHQLDRKKGTTDPRKFEEKSWQEEMRSHHHRAGNSSNNRNRDRLSHGRSQKQTQVICAE